MKAICPNCEQETNIETIKQRETFDVRGEPVEVDVEFQRCSACGDEFENTRGVDALALAYNKFRQCHNMLQPEDIKHWRSNYGLTQKEANDLLGWGGATLSRYENGALQAEAHENLLRLAMEPHNLLQLIEKTPKALNDKKRIRLIDELKAEEKEAKTFPFLLDEIFGGYDPDEFSGYQTLSLEKVFNAILFFCRGGEGQFKTKLNKLLFYSDFKHFKDYTVSITGVNYIHLPHGPIPDNYDFYYADLLGEKKLAPKEVIIGDYVGETYVALVEPDISVFSDSEIKILSEVKEIFKDYSATKIRSFSHNEKAYTETGDNEKITYLHATGLQI